MVKKLKVKSKKQTKAHKKPKLEIKFDPAARREFLTGFHKRKLQKKEFYKSKIEKRLVLEKQRIRAEAKKSAGRVSSSHAILPEVERIIGMTQADLENELKAKSESFVLGSKTVTISSLDDIHMKLPPINESDDEASSADEEKAKNISTQLPNSKTVLRRTTNRMLQQSKVFKTAQKLKQKGKKSRGNNRKAKEAKDKDRDRESSKGRPIKRGKNYYSQQHHKSKKGKKLK